MLQLIQPALSLVLGLALSVYGLTHTANHYPGHASFHALWQSLPAMSSVMVFALGLVAVGSGLALVATAVQGLRHRYRQLDHAMHTRPRNHDPYEEDDSAYGYR